MAIFSIALLIGILFLFFKFFAFIWRLLVCFIVSIPLWVVCAFIPFFLDETALVIGIILIALSWASRANENSVSSSSYSGYYSSDDYVLNKRSGVIHSKWDSSADTVGARNRRTISSSTADELVSRNGRYHYKKSSY